MTPLIFTPPVEPPRHTVVEINRYVSRETTPASAPGVVKASGWAFEVLREEFEPSFPEGVDYAKWEKGVTAAPRSAFADRLDLLDFE
jgi:hypothetical protein